MSPLALVGELDHRERHLLAVRIGPGHLVDDPTSGDDPALYWPLRAPDSQADPDEQNADHDEDDVRPPHVAPLDQLATTLSTTREPTVAIAAS